MPSDEGQGTAGTDEGGGAAGSQTSETEVTELRTQIETLTATVSERDIAIEASSVTVTELQAANKKFADDAVSLASQDQKLKDVQLQLEESRKTSTDLTTQLELAKTANSTLSGEATTRRRQDLVSKFGLPEERVAELDDAGLTTLESTLPHLPAASTNPPPNGTPNGLGLAAGPGSTDLSTMTDSERAGRIVERLKAKS